MKISPVNLANFNQRKVNFQSSFITAHSNEEPTTDSGIPCCIDSIRKTAGFDMTVTSECNGAHCKITVDNARDEALKAMLNQQNIYFEPADESSTAHMSPQRLVLPAFMRGN